MNQLTAKMPTEMALQLNMAKEKVKHLEELRS